MAKPISRNERFLGVLAFLFVAVFAGFLAWEFWLKPAPEAPPVDTSTVHATMLLKSGPVEIELFPGLAPKHVARITKLAEQHFYDGIVFHRVIDGFMAQTGDPTGTGSGGSDLPDLPAEFNDAPFERGTLGMARTADPNSANSQFFITFADASHLNGQYTVFGKVVSGMENIDKIKKGDSSANGLVTDPDKIISLRVSE